ncbi:GNAT family protein [Dyadobacter sp. LHD-138]|uniref:GNAT family N-acetyltransferase n=1 Tax=Dyadobacter sp. LHD-138 TaxID=3071413 RepID=UPI0027E086A2|nr:GNAT family protein [Dyadobacter sp. LHD-138]MDQ6480241.1 GNAT family protein [Dyadobacter sp. LHD-138]
MRLQNYSQDHFDLLNSWVTDADLLFQFAGTAWTFPLTPQQITNYQLSFPKRRFYMAFDDQDEAFAFGEIIVDDINTPRLGRLLVGKQSSRGQGLGLKFVNLLIDECKRTFSPDLIYLYVFENNLPAIRCYEKAGFVFDGGNKIVFTHESKSQTALVMKFAVDLAKS